MNLLLSTLLFSSAIFTSSIFEAAPIARASARALPAATQPTSSTLEGPSPTAPQTNPPRNYKTDALIYQGDATAYGDVESIQSILDSHNKTYDTVSSAELDQMKSSDFRQYGMIVWPGGYAGRMSNSLKTSTREAIRQAVTTEGVSYVGFCAGAFIAISPATSSGSAGPWGLSILNAPILPYYYLEDQGIGESMVQVQLPNGVTRHLVWWGGPYLLETPNGVIARYSKTNQPAITETWAGKGFMILSGPHPEAPTNWRTKLGLEDSDGLDFDLTWSMFDAALNQKPLPTLN